MCMILCLEAYKREQKSVTETTTTPEILLGLVDPDEERAYRIGELHRGVFRTLVSLRPETEITLDGTRYVLHHREEGAASVASVLYTKYSRTIPNGVQIHVNRALTLMQGAGGILLGESHIYKDVNRSYLGDGQPEEGTQTVEFPETMSPLNPDDLNLIKNVSQAAQAALRKRVE